MDTVRTCCHCQPIWMDAPCFMLPSVFLRPVSGDPIPKPIFVWGSRRSGVVKHTSVTVDHIFQEQVAVGRHDEPGLLGKGTNQQPSFFLGGENELLRKTMKGSALVEDGGVVRPNMDSALRHNKKWCLTLLRQLLSRGMLNIVERTKARAGVFFVWKSAKTKLRWIIDARPGNLFFEAPPSVALCSSETFFKDRDRALGPSTSNRSLLVFSSFE